MKKLTIIALALCLAFVMAAPVMAVDADFSGAYRVRGVYISNWDMDETSASNAFMNMRFRLQTVFKVSDILSVTTRFDALDNEVWGDTPRGTNADIDFDRAYMTIKAPIGTFNIGRQAGGGFGTTFVDSVSEYDRIKYSKVMDNLTILAIFQKDEEQDNAAGTKWVADTTSATDDEADEDSATYMLAGIYKAENITGGLLATFTNDKRASDGLVTDGDTRKYGLNPYFVSKFGPLGIQGEVSYKWGKTEYDDNSADLDIKQLAYNLEATYNFGPASVMAGYAFISGDDDKAKGGADNENSAFGSCGNDWEKLFILTTDEVPILDTDLGGIGNLSEGNDYGAKIIYGGATFSPLDNLKLGVVVGTADADKIQAGDSKDDYGIEYDFTLNWKIYDNLTYTAIAAYLQAGDFWWDQRAGLTTEPATFEDIYALFHQLQLSF